MAVWVQHRQNTSWEPATVVSQSSSNSYWIMQENGTDQPKVYRRTRSMLKIRSTDVRQMRHNYSQLTENEKAKFQNPFTYSDDRNFVERNPVKKISDDLVYLTKDTSSASILSELEERKSQKTFLYLQTFLHLHLQTHWRLSRNNLTLQDQESQRGRTLEGQPIHLVTFTCKRSRHYLDLD